MKHILLAAMLIVLAVQVHGQSIKVSGTITDGDGNSPLPGVSILVKGTANGTFSDADGKYAIDVAQGGTLVFSFIGYATQEVAVSNQAIVDIALAASTEMLSEVTVTALGIKREKKALGYAVSDINSKDIVGNGETNAISSLAGKLAGVAVSGTTAGPTGSTRVVIRGIRELSSNSQPLYVIDGVPAVNGNIASASQWGGMDLGDGLSDINPNDIESISVLKGAAAGALYGSRALNGVVMITTKSGNKGRGLGIEFNSSFTVDQVSTKLDERQKSYGQGNDGVFPTDPLQSQNIMSNWGPSFAEESSITQNDGTVRPYRYNENNIQDFFELGKTWMNTISLTGGDENHNVRFSYSNITNSDIIPRSGFDKDIFALRAVSKITKKLTLDAKVNYADERVVNRPALTDDVNNIGNGLIGLAANFDQAWLQKYQTEDGRYINYTGNAYRANPYWTINRTYNKSNKERVGGFVNLNYEINNMFSINLQGGTDFFAFKHDSFYDKYTPAMDPGALNQLEMTTKETNFQGMLNFKKDLGADFKIGAMAGANLMKYRSYGNRTNATGVIQPGTPNLVNFTTVIVTPFDDRKEVQSVFATANLSYKEYLYLNLQARNDWSSTLPAENRSFLYPSSDLSFVITDAFNSIQSPTLSFAKLRLAYGQVGQDFIPYMTGFAYGLTGRSFGDKPMGEIFGTNIPNGQLKPQIKTSFEIGTDIRLFNDRVGLDFTYYDEITDDALVNITVPETTGFNTASLNAAKLRNKGIEVLVRTTPLNMSNGFRWDLSFNFAKNNNEVVEISDEIANYTVAEARWAGATIIAEKGKPFGTIMGYGFERDENGKIIHNATGFPKTTATVIPLGNTLPDWTGGITNSFSYKGIELKAVFDIRVGGDMFSMTNMAMYANGSHLETEAGRESWNEYQQERRAAQLQAEADGQVPHVDTPGDPYYVPKNNRGFIGEGVNELGEVNNVGVSPAMYWQSITNNIPEPFIYDGSYIKLRDVSLTYNLPGSLLRGTPFRAVSLSAIGRNLLIIQKNTPNIDPESNYNVSNGQGFEYGSLPGRRRYGFNLVVKF